MTTKPSASLTVALHVLPLLNISDYITRNQTTVGSFAGVLLGQTGVSEVTIESMFEVGVLPDGQLDVDTLTTRLSQFRTSFPEYEVVGVFYLSSSLEIDSLGVSFYDQILPFNNMPVVMVLNPELIRNQKELPLRIYEADAGKRFKLVSYRIETGEAERIAVDGIMKESSVQGENDADELVSLLTLQSNALKMFNERLRIVNDYILRVGQGSIKPDFRILNQIDALVSQVSSGSSGLLDKAKRQQELDILVSAILAAVSKGTHIIMDLESKGGVSRS